MTVNREQQRSGSLFHQTLRRLKGYAYLQLREAEAELDSAERRYRRAQKELAVAREAYAKICEDDPEIHVQGGRPSEETD